MELAHALEVVERAVAVLALQAQPGAQPARRGLEQLVLEVVFGQREGLLALVALDEQIAELDEALGAGVVS